MPGLIEWAVGKFAEWGLTRTLDKVSAPHLPDRLRKTVDQWARQLPAEAYVYPAAMVLPLAQGYGKPRPERKELTHLCNVLLDGYPPSPDLWLAALREHWEIRRLAVEGEAQPFFSRRGDDVEVELRRLAEALYRVCEEDPKFFQREMLRRTKLPQVAPAAAAPSAFVTASEFYRPLMERGRLFHHAWRLVGREDVLNVLLDFTHSAQQQVAVLPGRGGIGKTKLLQEFARRVQESDNAPLLRFIAPTMPLGPEIVDELAGARSVVVVDDAHRHEDLEVLLSALKRAGPATRVLLTTRPSGTQRVLSVATRAGFDIREILRMQELGDLSREQMRELAQQVLGRRHTHLTEALVAATSDSPLLTVIGGKLVAEGQVHPLVMQQHEDFRRTILGTFEDVLLGNVSDRVPQDLCRELLRVVAAVSPVNVTSEAFQNAAAALLRVRQSVVVSATGVLEGAGVLLRRGLTLRITPDVLGDFVLEEACISQSGVPTGYAREVFDAFGSRERTHILKNLAELDWRTRNADGEGVNLLADIWSDVEEEFRVASASQRAEIMRTLVDLAFYQAERCLSLVEYAIQNPPTSPEPARDLVPLHDHVPSQEDVLRAVPSVLRGIAYNAQFTVRACDLLWELGRDDPRPPNSNPDHALRVLEDLAEYQEHKPVEFNEVVLSAVLSWMERPGVHDHLHSPLDILDPLLVRIGQSHRAEGSVFELSAMQINPDATKSLRRQVFEQVAILARSENLKVAVRAISSLEEAVRPLLPVYGLELSEKDHEAWHPEQLHILGILSDLCHEQHDPLVYLMCARAVGWHVLYGPPGTIKEKAREIVASVPRSFELKLTEVLLAQPVDVLHVSGNDADKDASKSWERREQQQGVVATEFVSRTSSAEEAFVMFVDRMGTLERSGADLSPSGFLRTLARVAPDYAAVWCELAAERKPTPVGEYLGSMWDLVMENDQKRALALAQRLVHDGDPILCSSLAAGFRLVEWENEVGEEYLQIFRDLLTHEDVWVRNRALASLQNLGRTHPRLAIDLALGANVGTHSQLAEELCRIFDETWGVTPEFLSQPDWVSLLSKLEAVDEIGGYNTNRFLSSAGSRVPRDVVQLLLTRLERREGRSLRYRALPFDFQRFPLEGLAQSSDYKAILREIRDRSLNMEIIGWHWLPRLYRAVSNRYDDAGREVLVEWVHTGDPDRIRAVGRLVSSAGPNFVFDYVDFVSDLLGCADASGEEIGKEVARALWTSTHSGTYTRTVGQPSERDVAVRDTAGTLAQRSDLPLAARQFYASLAAEAEQSIRDDLARDEQELE